MTQRNPYAPPEAEVDLSPSSVAAAPPLWNPNAAASWSLLLSPVFGAILHMKNWEALGEPQKAASARSWAIGSLVFFVLLTVVAAVAGESKALDGFSRIGGLALLITWYYASGKAQQNYVLARYGKDYPRRGWLKPLFFAVVAFAGSVAILFVIGFVTAWLIRT